MPKNKEEKATEKYVKVNPYYYQQQDDGRPLNWFKLTERLYVKLYDFQPILNVSLKGENEEFNLGGASTIDENSWKLARDKSAKAISTEGKTSAVSNAFNAKAVFQDRYINFFENGQLSSCPYYESAEFNCIEGDGLGSLIHNAGDTLDYDKSHNEPYLSIETYLPPELFQKVLQQIKEDKISEVLVCLKCDVFQSEVERSLAEPWMKQKYTIEAESYNNFCGIEWIRIGGRKYIPRPKIDDDFIENEHNTNSDVSLELQIASLFAKELRHTNKMLKAIAVTLGILAILQLFVH